MTGEVNRISTSQTSRYRWWLSCSSANLLLQIQAFLWPYMWKKLYSCWLDLLELCKICWRAIKSKPKDKNVIEIIFLVSSHKHTIFFRLNSDCLINDKTFTLALTSLYEYFMTNQLHTLFTTKWLLLSTDSSSCAVLTGCPNILLTSSYDNGCWCCLILSHPVCQLPISEINT